MPTFIHLASGRRVTVHGRRAARLERLTSWEQTGGTPDLAPDQNDDPVHVDRAGQLVDPPPKAGPGSSRDAWATYAAQLGVDVDDGDTRDDIIAAVGR